VKSVVARSRGESGQVLVFVAFILVALVGMAALVVDVGSWFHAQRKLQTAADAAALAGAQHLPTQQSTALTVALDYAQRNDSGIPDPTVTFPNAATIDVVAKANTPGIFAPVLNSAFDIVNVRAEAQAQVSAPTSLKNVAPIAVKNTAACIVLNPSCFGQTTTVKFDDSAISSSTVGLLDLRCQSSSSSVSCGGGPGGSTLADWIRCAPCWPGTLPTNAWYDDKTGETTGPIKSALNDAAAAGTVLLIPVFDVADASAGSFHVIGWAAFVIDPGGVNWGPHVKTLTGHFVTFIATDVAGGNPSLDPANDFGVHVITLTK
jgi:Flp pilus assembly protein TadG